MPKDDLFDESSQAIADLLERSGHTREEARVLAKQAVHLSRTVSKGCGYGGLHPEDLGRLWSTAASSGKRRLVLEITAEGDRDEYHGQLRVQVLDAEEWPDPELDHLRRGQTAPDLWMPSDDEQTGERPRPEELN